MSFVFAFLSPLGFSFEINYIIYTVKVRKCTKQDTRNNVCKEDST